MLESSSTSSNVLTLDTFYEQLAEQADEEGLSLPWYKTYIVHTPELKRFRSELTLPRLCLKSLDEGYQYFIPEAKFSAIAQNRTDAENIAAGEACEYFKNLTQKSHLIASEWNIDRTNTTHQRLVELSLGTARPSTQIADIQPLEGQHTLTITAEGVRPFPREQERPSTRVTTQESMHQPGPSIPESEPDVHREPMLMRSGNLHEPLSDELRLLRDRIEILSESAERKHIHWAASASIIPVSSPPNIQSGVDPS